MAFLGKPTIYIGTRINTLKSGRTGVRNKQSLTKQRPRPEYSKATMHFISSDNREALLKLVGSKSELERTRSVLANLVYSACQRVAYCKREMEFELTVDYLASLYIQQQGLCYYTRRVMDIRSSRSVTRSQRTNPNKVSLDRLDSEKGYTLDNVVLCCWSVNQAKAALSISEFVDMCLDVSLNTALTIT